ncbi:MAG: hypothetical protein ACJA07_003655 [Rhodococcus sp. (in: high G+C Gram-positive bacteria)]
MSRVKIVYGLGELFHLRLADLVHIVDAITASDHGAYLPWHVVRFTHVSDFTRPATPHSAGNIAGAEQRRYTRSAAVLQ